MQVFPPDNPWNQDISAMPVHPDSRAMIASVGGTRASATTSTWASSSPPDQKKVPVKLLEYPDQSIRGRTPC
jgi:hypothetical protein